MTLSPQNRRRLLYGVPVALFVVLALFAVLQLTGGAPPTSFLTAPAVRGDIEDAVLATGEIEALRQVSVGAQVSGQIKSLKVALGDTVKQGELIAEIDSLTQQNALRNAEAALASSEAQLRAKQATVKQTELAYKRQATLRQANVSSVEDYETAEAAYNVAIAEVGALQAEIAQARITVDTARVNLGYTRITAPIDGTVVAVVAKEGQTLNANQSTPTIIKLAQLDNMTIKAEISEADVPRVKAGVPVYFTILGQPDKRYTANLRAVEPAPESISTDTTSSTTTTTTSTSTTAIYYNGLFDVPNPDGVLRISMTTEVHIVLAERRGVLTIPSSAVGERLPDGSYQVRVLDNAGQAAPRRIKIGLNNKVSAEVLEGLKEGEQVVVGEASGTAVSASSSQRPGPPPM